MVLWEEYRAVQPGGYGYSRFCDLFRGFERRLSAEHAAGSSSPATRSLSITPARRSPSSIRTTGEMREAEIFVAVLGASNFTYAEATWTQTLADWIGAHVRMFRFFGGVPRLVVPDNLKAGVHKASFYDPELNRSYGMMASHYGVGILPARPRRPKDKSKVENRRPLRPDLYPRPPSPPDLLLARRCQRGHRRRAGPHQRSCHPPARRHPPPPLRDHRDASPGAPAGCRLRVRRVAARPRRRRLSRRATRLLLLGAARPDPGAGRRPRDQPHHRAVPSRPTGRRCISAATAAVGTAPIPITCPARTAAMRTGRRTASAAGRLRSGRTPKPWSRPSWPIARIPSRAFGPASVCCGCSATSKPPAPKPSRPAPCGSVRSPTRASLPSWPTAWAARPATTEPEAVIDHVNLRGPSYFH